MKNFNKVLSILSLSILMMSANTMAVIKKGGDGPSNSTIIEVIGARNSANITCRNADDDHRVIIKVTGEGWTDNTQIDCTKYLTLEEMRKIKDIYTGEMVFVTTALIRTIDKRSCGNIKPDSGLAGFIELEEAANDYIGKVDFDPQVPNLVSNGTLINKSSPKGKNYKLQLNEDELLFNGRQLMDNPTCTIDTTRN